MQSYIGQRRVCVRGRGTEGKAVGRTLITFLSGAGGDQAKQGEQAWGWRV